MNFNKYTEKSQAAVLAAQKMALDHNHTQIEPEHLLLALIEQEEGVVPRVLTAFNVDLGQMTAQLRTQLERQARAANPTEPRVSTRLNLALDQAEKEADQLKDEYISTEHLLLGIADKDSGAAGYVGVHGEAHGSPPYRRASRLYRL